MFFDTKVLFIYLLSKFYPREPVAKTVWGQNNDFKGSRCLKIGKNLQLTLLFVIIASAKHPWCFRELCNRAAKARAGVQCLRLPAWCSVFSFSIKRSISLGFAIFSNRLRSVNKNRRFRASRAHPGACSTNI